MVHHTTNMPIKCGTRKSLCSTFANFKECVVWEAFGTFIVVISIEIVVVIVEHLFLPLVPLFLHIFHCCMGQCCFLDANWSHPNLCQIGHFVYENVFNLATWSNFCIFNFDNNPLLPMKNGHDFSFECRTLNESMTIDTNYIFYISVNHIHVLKMHNLSCEHSCDTS